ncbi:MAG: preprotein translocase subunit SecE [Phycisphaerales bacterium]|nr:preprotein translocase subunit SecE [Phycisphaerales bacterium]
MTKTDQKLASTSAGPQRALGSTVSAAGRSGFFTIYKHGQGYWTRLMTYLGFLLLGGLTGQFIYSQTHAWIGSGKAVGIASAFVVIWAIVEYLIINKPASADFLIATDSEMKKVNWTTRKELIGSTKVVIFFMFLLTAVLFFYDMVFHTIFWLISVLKSPPPFITG